MSVELVPGPGPTAEDRHVRQREDDDFQEGYEAGYNARAERRAALGTPAYRQGHAYGVQQAIADRAVRAKRATPAGKLWRAVLIGFAIGCLLAMGLVKCAAADTLDDWQVLNEMCQGGSGTAADKACVQRQRASAQLRREGWFEGGHGVWVSPVHVAAFTRVARSYDAAAREAPGMIGSMQVAFMDDLRRAVPDEAIFALWNGRAGTLLAHTPYAASMLMFGLPYLERTLSGRNDPRFRMVLRP